MTTVTRNRSCLVVLLGWWQSSPKHLKKYATLYNRLGYETYEYIAPTYVLVGGPVVHFLAARSLIGKIDKKMKQNKHQKVVFHSFSNNGCVMYLGCQRVLQMKKYDWDQCGSIFDSCPGSLEPDLFFRALIEAYPKQPMRTFVQLACISPLVPFLYYLLQKQRPLLHLLQLVGAYTVTTGILNFLYHREVVKMSHTSPHLYIYSKDDALVRHDVVVKVADAVSRRGIQVTKKEFTDSKHVAHLQRYPDAYRDTLIRFYDSLEM